MGVSFAATAVDADESESVSARAVGAGAVATAFEVTATVVLDDGAELVGELEDTAEGETSLARAVGAMPRPVGLHPDQSSSASAPSATRRGRESEKPDRSMVLHGAREYREAGAPLQNSAPAHTESRFGR